MANFVLTATPGAPQYYLDGFFNIAVSGQLDFPTAGTGSFTIVYVDGRDGSQTHLIFGGFALTYRMSGPTVEDVTGGRITSLVVHDGSRAGPVSLSVTGLSLSAAEVYDLMGNDDVGGLLGLVFGRNDVILGSGLRDEASGYAGADRLEGRRGDDILFGNAGADTLHGDQGRDRLTGGSGADRFVFDTAAQPGNADVITDFTPGTDRILLQNDVLAGLGGGGGLRAAQFVAGTQAADAQDRIIYDRATGRIWLDSDGRGGAPQVLLAEVDDGTRLTAADFLIL